MNRSILPLLAVGLSTALMAQSKERAPKAEHLYQVQIRGISG